MMGVMMLFCVVCSQCYLAEERGEDFAIWGSGRPLRQFIYSLDLAELTIWTMRHYHVSSTQLTRTWPARQVRGGGGVRHASGQAGLLGGGAEALGVCCWLDSLWSR
jgi:hypothetical protein